MCTSLFWRIVVWTVEGPFLAAVSSATTTVTIEEETGRGGGLRTVGTLNSLLSSLSLVFLLANKIVKANKGQFNERHTRFCSLLSRDSLIDHGLRDYVSHSYAEAHRAFCRKALESRVNVAYNESYVIPDLLVPFWCPLDPEGLGIGEDEERQWTWKSNLMQYLWKIMWCPYGCHGAITPAMSFYHGAYG